MNRGLWSRVIEYAKAFILLALLMATVVALWAMIRKDWVRIGEENAAIRRARSRCEARGGVPLSSHWTTPADSGVVCVRPMVALEAGEGEG